MAALRLDEAEALPILWRATRDRLDEMAAFAGSLARSAARPGSSFTERERATLTALARESRALVIAADAARRRAEAYCADLRALYAARSRGEDVSEREVAVAARALAALDALVTRDAADISRQLGDFSGHYAVCGWSPGRLDAVGERVH